MSLMAASFTKSSVVGVMPRVEFTPVFSPTDWAIAGVARRASARPEARIFIAGSFPVSVKASQSIKDGLDRSSPVQGVSRQAKCDLDIAGKIAGGIPVLGFFRRDRDNANIRIFRAFPPHSCRDRPEFP